MSTERQEVDEWQDRRRESFYPRGPPSLLTLGSLRATDRGVVKVKKGNSELMRYS